MSDMASYDGHPCSPSCNIRIAGTNLSHSAVVIAHLPPLANSIDREVLGVDAAHLGNQDRIAFGCVTAQLRIATAGGMREVRRRGDRQHLADRLDSEAVAMLVGASGRYGSEPILV
jgi:hypothetical protein